MLFVTGCAAQSPVAVGTSASPRPVEAVPETKTVETRYDVRGYREAADPSVRHEAHALFRSTNVPITVAEEPATVSRTTNPSASYAPLPASDELAAEIYTQKTITEELRLMQASVAETERRVQAQYAALVRQSGEAVEVREQLEMERARLRAASPSGIAGPPTVAPAGSPPEVKW